MLLAVRKAPVDRRFTMRDAMILVAASSVAFALLHPLDGPLKMLGRWYLFLAYSIVALMVLSPAALILRLIGPRPPLHRLTRQPGFAASVAGSTIVVLGLLLFLLFSLIRLIKADLAASAGAAPALEPFWWAEIITELVPVVGPSIVACWSMLAVSGRRRPVRSWLDYLGRAIGVAWIVLFVAKTCADLASSIQ